MIGIELDQESGFQELLLLNNEIGDWRGKQITHRVGSCAVPGLSAVFSSLASGWGPECGVCDKC